MGSFATNLISPPLPENTPSRTRCGFFTPIERIAMLRAHIPTPPKPAPFTEAQAHKADMTYHQAKLDDPYRQREADRTALREIQLRAATGQMF